MTIPKYPLRFLAAALGLGWSADLLFYGHNPGISVLLFVILVLGSLAALSKQEGVSLARRNLWLIEPLLFFAGMIFVRANPTLTLVNICAVLVLLCLLVFFFAADRIERLGLLGYPAVLLTTLRRAFVEPVPPARQLAASASRYRPGMQTALPVLRGVMIALPVLIVFTLLLASADLFFASYVQDLLKVHISANLPELMVRLTLILTVAWICTGAFYFALLRGASGSAAELYSRPGEVRLQRKIGFPEGATVLALVNCLFAAFAWVQFAFLFSGQAARTMNYQEYRDYVRQGFGQLLVAALLSMALILGLRSVVRFAAGRQERVFAMLCTAIIALTLVMLVSAFWRMLLWENIEFYINTPLRIFIRVFIVFLGLTFGWLLFTLLFKQDRFAMGAFLAALAFLMTINIMNPDADVAAYNLAHRGDELATRYLYLLSDDAVPVLVDGLKSADIHGRAAIQEDLDRRLRKMEADTGWRDWQSFHISHREAYSMLHSLRATLQPETKSYQPGSAPGADPQTLGGFKAPQFSR